MFPSEILHERFDFVINVSALEEVPESHLEILKNHLVQLKKRGRFIGTFDLPGLQLDACERLLEERIVVPPSRLTPRNSRLEDKTLGLPDDYNIGYVVIERTE